MDFFLLEISVIKYDFQSLQDRACTIRCNMVLISPNCHIVIDFKAYIGDRVAQ